MPGRFTVDVVPVAGLVGALLNVLPVVDVLEVELVVAGFVVELDDVPGRRRPLVVVVLLVGRFAAVALEDVFFAAGDEGDAASACGATLGMSVSDMMQSIGRLSGGRGANGSVGKKGGVAINVPSCKNPGRMSALSWTSRYGTQ